MVDVGAEQGLNDFETAGLTDAMLRIALKLHYALEKLKTPLWAKI